jgi:hypothetical protein
MDDTRPDPAAAAPAVVTAERVRVAGEAVRIGAPARDRGGEPAVHLVREDGVIRAIDVTCRCGERIRIRCDYA